MQLPTPPAGTVERGWLDVADLPTGGPERLPVVVVAGGDPGPTAWVTAGVHGDESTGVAAAQDVANAFGDVGSTVGVDGDDPLVDPADLSGRLVCVPIVNPAGLRRTSRTSYYHGEDPNRSFPDPADGATSGSADGSPDPPTVQELVAERLYEGFADADVLLDLHTAQVHSVAFAIRHRVLYGEVRDRAAAEALNDDLDRLVDALGLPVVTGYPASEYVDRGLHRTAVGAALNGAGVPAVTLELGGHSTVDEAKLAAGVADVFRALVAFDMLDAVPSAVRAADPGPEPPVDFRVRRHRGPRTATAGVVRHRVAPGRAIEAGEPIAELRSATGERRGTVAVDHDGYVLAHHAGVAAYENDPVASLAVRDEEPLVAARPTPKRSS